MPDPSVVELYLTEIAKAYNVEWAPRPQGTPGPISSTIGMPLPLPGMPVQAPQEAPGGLDPSGLPAGLPQGGGGTTLGGTTLGGTTLGLALAAAGSLSDGRGGATPFSVSLMKTPLGFGMQLDGDN